MLLNVGGHGDGYIFAGTEDGEDGLDVMIGIVRTVIADVAEGMLADRVIDEGLDFVLEGQANLQDGF
jgi:hypothetical protein